MLIKSAIKRIIHYPGNMRAKLKLRWHHIEYGKNLSVRGNLYIRNKGRASIGENVQIISSEKGNPIGGWERTYFQVLPNAELRLEDGCAISNCAITCGNKIAIGKNTFIGAGVRIYDTDFHSINPYIRCSENDRFNVKTAPVEIGDYVFIGAGSIILKNVKIGKMSVIGAGSVVTCSVPEQEVWAGNPARFVRKLREEELQEVEQSKRIKNVNNI